MSVQNRMFQCLGTILGQSGTGKTSIILRWVRNTFDMAVPATMGVDFQAKSVYFGDRAVRLRMWDTAGQERFLSLIPAYVRDCSVVLVVYDITSRESFDRIDFWVQQVRSERGEEVPIYLIGNKADLESDRAVKEEEGEAKAASINAKFFEVSAKEGTNIKKLFMQVAQDFLESADPSVAETTEEQPSIMPENQERQRGCPC